MRWLVVAREYDRVPLNSPPLFICCWNCTSHLRAADSYSKAHELVMYQHVLFSFRKVKKEFITIALLVFLFLPVLQSLRIIQWSPTHLTWRLISMVSFNKPVSFPFTSSRLLKRDKLIAQYVGLKIVSDWITKQRDYTNFPFVLARAQDIVIKQTLHKRHFSLNSNQWCLFCSSW